MNERIKELHDESLIYEEKGIHEGNYILAIKQNPQKFAELIIRKCALIAGLMEQQGRTGIGAQILDNFEIKE